MLLGSGVLRSRLAVQAPGSVIEAASGKQQGLDAIRGRRLLARFSYPPGRFQERAIRPRDCSPGRITPG